MNIRQAKETIGNTVRSYLEKDDDGAYYIPAVQQRPLLLMGPPGIGKTAIVEQLAAEYGIGLVSYNMTHHTRQSAVGLPHPADREYNGKTVTVTEYTLSEIVASVYDCMEDTGKREGILFIDEINCVSETLAPCMLQFLQKKRFGSWQIPEGWVIVAAGNPRVFNRSARDYDIAVLDRLRTLSVQPDLDVWMSYAQKDGVHGAVLSYLAFHREHFFIVRQDKETTEYVTARGWQDLSTLLFSCERLEIRVDQDLVFSYLAVREIAEAFTDYYMLFRKCRQDMEKYGNGSAAGWGSWLSVLSSMAESSDSQECHILAGLLLEKLGTAFARYAKEEMLLSLGAQRFEETERTLKARNTDEEPLLLVLGLLEKWKESLRVRSGYHLITEQEERLERSSLHLLHRTIQTARESHRTDAASLLSSVSDLLVTRTREHEKYCADTQKLLTEAVRFAEEHLPEKEQHFLIMELAGNENAVSFLSSHGCDAFFRFSRKYLGDL